jgi:hypothetical protein
LANKKHTNKDTYDFIKTYYAEWFPTMPKYKAYNKRVCYLSDAIKALADGLMRQLKGTSSCVTHLIDSMPVVVAKQSRSSTAKVAPDLCDKGYCDSKKMYYYGVKLHVLGQSVYKTLPQPRQMLLTSASVHDKKAAEEMLDDVFGIDLFADKAYKDVEWEARLAKNQKVRIFAPVKLQKGQEFLSSADKLFSSAVSAVRQPIESFFNWLQQLTQIQNACKVRSSNGLAAFIFARIALACFVLTQAISV